MSPDDISQSVLLLLNVIYFNGNWLHPFPEDQNTVAEFALNRTQSVLFPFIQNTANYYYSESAELSATTLRLPHTVSLGLQFLFAFLKPISFHPLQQGNRYAMYIMLPQSADGFERLLTRLDSTQFYRAKRFLSEVKVKVALPKIKFDNTIKLKEALQDVSGGGGM